MDARTEWIDFDVSLTLRLSTRIGFAPRDPDAPEPIRILPSDAIANAIGHIPEHVLRDLADAGFAIAYPIDGDAHEEV